MSIQYNALEYAHQLEAAGVPQAQAEVHANMLGRVLADCVAVPADLRTLRGDLTHQIAETETLLRAEIAATEARLRAEIAEATAQLGARIDAVEVRVLAEIDKQSRFQKLSNGLIATLLVGLYIQLLFH